MKRQYNFNYGWKFHEGDCANKTFDAFGSHMYKEPQWLKSANNGVAKPTMDDSDWLPVNLPHDFVIERCEFSAETPSSVGSLKKGMAWYRKTFMLPEEIKDQRIFIKFDGVFRDSQVWCNGHFMGRHLGGYLGFEYELTEIIHKDEPNTIAVFADGRGFEGWWYEGGGIYRDVTLVATSPVRIADNGIFAKPYDIDLSANTCSVDVELTLDSNQFKDVTACYTATVADPSGAVVASFDGEAEIPAFERATVLHTVALDNLALWDLDNTQQYTVTATVNYLGNADTVCQTFGIRKITYAPETGMFLNGNRTYMKGVCGHDDFAGVGTAMNRSVIETKVKTLLKMGCNAYRCSHNPPSPVFLDVCDQLGMFVIDETRLPGTSREMQEDFITLIKRDRNHPCVVFFSMGNEEMGIQDNRMGTNIFSRMQAIGKKYDDSRDYLYAINADKNKNVDFIEGDGLHLPVHGVNYVTNRYNPCFDWLIERHPTCCFVSTETTGSASVRGYQMDNLSRPQLSEEGARLGVFTNKAHEGILTCYGDFNPMWSFTPELSIKEHSTKPYMLGSFLWTGFDYRGEVFPYLFPQVVSSYGIIDLCGIFKDWAYHVQAWWGNKPVLHIFPSWNLPEPEGTPISVWAFTNCDEVELVLNGKSMGKQTVEALGHLEWTVPYEKGTIEAFGYKDGVQTLYEKSVTAGEACQLKLTTEQSEILANHDDNTIVTVEVLDANGNPLTDSEMDISFAISGVGSIKGVGNGNPQSLEHDKKPARKLYAGKAIAIIEGTFDAGEITLTATAEGVAPASITLTATACDCTDYIFSSGDVTYGSTRVQVVDL